MKKPFNLPCLSIVFVSLVFLFNSKANANDYIRFKKSYISNPKKSLCLSKGATNLQIESMVHIHQMLYKLWLPIQMSEI